jgi:hypothetical protein
MRQYRQMLSFGSLIIIVTLLLAACGGGGGGGGTGTNQDAPDMSAVPESMTPDERNAAMDTVNLAWGGINTGSLATDNQALVAYINTLPDFADAGISADGTVWARFKDGYPVIFKTKIVPPGTVISAPKMNPARAITRSPIPQGDKAVLVDVDLLADGSLGTIQPALQKKGYTPSRLRGTVAEFLSIKNVSVLFISSHGGTQTTKSGKLSYVVMTNEKVAPFDPLDANANSLKALYRADELTMAGVRVRDTNGVQISVPGSYWSVTDVFVKNNWSFTGNSLVVLDTCELFKDNVLTAAADKVVYQNFRAALTGAGAAVLVGWDGQVSPGFASNVMQLFFDRVLGANAYQPESPLQRPFSFKDVHDWLVSSGKHHETAGGALMLQGSGQLVPTIQRALVYTPAAGAQHAGKWILELSGEFNTEAGIVTVNNIERPWLSWTDHNIIVELPASMDSPGSSGDVVVEVRQHRSNALPLTQWTGTVRQAQLGTDIGSVASVDITCPVRATVDVHFNRETPGVTPKMISSLFFEVVAPCAYTLSGSWSETISGETNNYVLSGSGNVSPLVNEKIAGNLLYTGGGSALPLDFSGSILPPLLIQGNLQKNHVSPLPTYTTNSPAYAGWTFAQTGVNSTSVRLNADYSFTAARSCIGLAGTKPTQCTETWNVQPLLFTKPTASTES